MWLFVFLVGCGNSGPLGRPQPTDTTAGGANDLVRLDSQDKLDSHHNSDSHDSENSLDSRIARPDADALLAGDSGVHDAAVIEAPDAGPDAIPPIDSAEQALDGTAQDSAIDIGTDSEQGSIPDSAEADVDLAADLAGLEDGPFGPDVLSDDVGQFDVSVGGDGVIQDDTGGAPLCQEATDCPAPPGCMVVACVGGSCQVGPALDASPCLPEDPSPCAPNGTCQAGSCIAEPVDCPALEPCSAGFCQPLTGLCEEVVVPGCAITCTTDWVCDDGDVCSDDFCSQGTCAHVPTIPGTPCSDGNPCTSADSCAQGECAGQAVVCAGTGPCSADQCNNSSGLCVPAPLPSGTLCNDGDACTTKDACTAGTCVGQAKVCSDGQPCTADFCEAGDCSHAPIANCTGSCTVDKDCPSPTVCKSVSCLAGLCISAPASGSCDDLDACTAADTCVAGSCNGVAMQCDDQNPCTTDSCSSGVCQFVANNGSCDDGDPCTVADTCAVGDCNGVEKLCADNNPCTQDSCQEGSCLHSPEPGPCDDGDACTVADACLLDTCVGAPIPCDDNTPCTADSCSAGECAHGPLSGGWCDDGEVCTTADTCVAGQCNGSALVCSDGNPCTDDACKSTVGCYFVATDGGLCDDGAPCSLGDSCVDGQCLGTAKLCDDANACTADSCDPQSGGCVQTAIPGCGVPCQSTADCISATTCTAVSCVDNLCAVQWLNGSDCSDNQPCTVGEQCQGGVCQAGKPKICSDNNACTADTCNALSGKCQFQALPDLLACSDGLLCTINDICAGGRCVAGPGPACDDTNPCTWDSCNPLTGECLWQPQPLGSPCDDGNACTTADQCGVATCSGEAVDCNDSDPCTQDACQAGQCQHQVFPGCFVPCDGDDDCEDGNPCTADSCDTAASECLHLPADTATCEDGQLCTTQTCTGGVCQISIIDCQDSNLCTVEACDPASGACVSVAAPTGAPCSDGDACSQTDACTAGACVGSNHVVCEDGDSCTLDACLPQNGQCVAAIIGGCGDNCSSQADCEDGNDCTEETCQGGQCVVTVSGLQPCDDGDSCTPNDTCSGPVCVAGPTLACGDEDPCTAEWCDSASGTCASGPAPTGTACQDGVSCTVADSCLDGQCAGTPVTCSDNDACTLDACNPSTGLCAFLVQKDCGDSCYATSQCSDSNPCTIEQCKQGKCQFIPLTDTACTDNNACTNHDRCSSGICFGIPVVCDDGSPCTQDLCHSGSGSCVSAAGTNGLPCEDGDACTSQSYCAGGHCAATLTIACDDGNPCTTDRCSAQTGACEHLAIAGCNQSCSGADDCGVAPACGHWACQSGSCVLQMATSGPCDDADLCTVLDTCGAAGCTGVATLCHDGNPCTLDTCAPDTGNCLSVQLPEASTCTDGNACTSADLCTGGSCKGTVKSCSDGNLCTIDSCEVLTGQCASRPVAACGAPCFHSAHCSDGDPCTAETCSNYKCGFTLPSGNNCSDGNTCTSGDRCQQGQCVGSAVVCQDGSPCTVDWCSSGKCQSTAGISGGSCDDGNDCTQLDACKAGSCNGLAVSCDDANPCTLDACAGDNALCAHVLLPGCGAGCQTDAHCQDGNPCTTRSCLDGACVVTVLTNASCDDGDLCTVAETCLAGQCQAGLAFACEDGNPCTANACNPLTGHCSAVAEAASCSDGNPCTKSDMCTGGQCVGNPAICEDNNPCTADSCNPQDGKCSFVVQGNCGKPCTGNAQCNDGNGCTADLCSDGICASLPDDQASCSDGNLCTSGDACVGGQCQAQALLCADGEVCTVDVCNPASGVCNFTALAGCGPGCQQHEDCSDGDLCTIEFCNSFTRQCIFTALANCNPLPPCQGAAACDDSDPCTQDLCNTTNGACSNLYMAGCNPNDLCTADADCDDGKPCTLDSCNGFNLTCLHVTLDGCQ